MTDTPSGAHPANPLPPAPGFTPRQVTVILQDEARRNILRELAKDGNLPVGELARRCRINPNRTSKNLRLLKDQKMVTTVYGVLYTLVPALRPAPGATHLDFGEILLRI